jgi:hypothetical protein
MTSLPAAARFLNLDRKLWRKTSRKVCTDKCWYRNRLLIRSRCHGIVNHVYLRKRYKGVLESDLLSFSITSIYKINFLLLFSKTKNNSPFFFQVPTRTSQRFLKMRLTNLLAFISATAAVTISYDTGYDDSSRSLGRLL